MKTDILTSLAFLNVGQPWPPPTQKARLARYAENARRYRGEKAKRQQRALRLVFEWAGDFMRKLGGPKDRKQKMQDYERVLAFQKKISLKTADFLFQEEPVYSNPSKEKQAVIDAVVEASKLNAKGYSATIDTSRFGEGIYLVRRVDGKNIATLSQPRYWFPVTNPADVKDIKQHVLAWEEMPAKPTKKTEKKKQRVLIVHIHEVGKIFVRKLLVEEGEIKSKIEEETEQATGLPDFAVVPTQAIVTADTIYGDDDYTDINGLIDEMQIRLAQIGKILDKHAEPSMTGPMDALQYNEETGEWSLKAGNYFPAGEGQPAANYLTWDGKLDASFKHLDKLLNLISIISEMGPALFDTNYANRSNLSGKALRFLFVDVLAKIARYKKAFDAAHKQVIWLCSQEGYTAKLDLADTSIKWHDGLPNDPEELANIAKTRTAEKATDTVAAQIMAQDGVSEEDAKKKAAAIALEEAASMPAIGSGLAFPPAGDPPEEIEDDETPVVDPEEETE